MPGSERDFDVMLSFSGSERPYAQAIAAIAKANGLRVFLDEDQQHEIWGQNLVEYLDDAYRDRGLYCLVLISEEYIKRGYTRTERRAAFDRMLDQEGVYILPVTVDGSWIKGLPRSTGYLDLRLHGVLGVCTMLLKKLQGPDAELTIPDGVAIPRVPNGAMPPEILQKHLLEYCAERPVAVFGALVYDERQAEVRKLLRDRDYWDALDIASGPDFEVFAVRDEERWKGEHVMYEMTAISASSAHSRGTYYSKLLKELFGEDGARLVYPSVVLYLVTEKRITHCRLIPFRRAGIDATFQRLQALFTTIASCIQRWSEEVADRSSNALWNELKSALLAEHYTLYIQRPPRDATTSIEGLVGFAEQPTSSDGG